MSCATIILIQAAGRAIHARLMSKNNPEVVELVRSQLPLASFALHPNVSGEGFVIPTMITYTGHGEMVDRHQGAVYLNAPGQSIVVTYGQTHESALVNKFAEVLQEDLSELTAMGSAIYNYTLATPQHKVVPIEVTMLCDENIPSIDLYARNNGKFGSTWKDVDAIEVKLSMLGGKNIPSIDLHAPHNVQFGSTWKGVDAIEVNMLGDVNIPSIGLNAPCNVQFGSTWKGVDAIEVNMLGDVNIPSIYLPAPRNVQFDSTRKGADATEGKLSMLGDENIPSIDLNAPRNAQFSSTWKEVEAMFLAEAIRALKSEPNEIRTCFAGIIPSGMGTGGNALPVWMHQWSFLMTIGPSTLYRFLIEAEIPGITLEMMVDLTHNHLLRPFNYFEFLDDLGLTKFKVWGEKYSSALDQLKSLTEYKKLTTALLTLVNLYHRRVQSRFPFFLGRSFPHISKEEVLFLANVLESN